MIIPTRSDLTILFKLALPLIIGGLIEGSVGFFTVLFLSHLSEKAVAAGALAGWLFGTATVVMWGTLSAISVLISHKQGANDQRAVSWVLRDSFLLAILFFIPGFLLLWQLPSFLLWFGQSPELTTLATAYVHALSFSLLPNFIVMVLLQFFIGLGHTRVSMVFSLLLVPVNIFFNYVLVFGQLGFPDLGIAGIGWGTSLSFWIMSMGLFIYLLLRKEYRRYLPDTFTLARPKFIGELIKIGIPTGAMYCLEIGFFLVLTLMLGRLGNQTLVANQIAIQYLGQIITVAFAIAGAITVRMGHLLGARDPEGANRAASAGILFSVGIMGIISMCYWIFPLTLIGIDFEIDNPENAILIKMAVEFLGLCAFFQLAESIRIPLYGALRALKDTRLPFFSTLLSFWIIPLPLGWLLAEPMGWGGKGYWCAMILGAIVGMLILMWRFQYKMKQHLSFFGNRV